MTLVVLDDEGEKVGELGGVELYDLGNRYWSDQVVDWIDDTINEEK
jgi:hypothetical protein